ncbi:MAG: hypothetical protein M3Z08_17180 [Chloroflexota bacterium]|nr:hypothetical protein [Chloroflexota bacterium]
MFTITRSKSPMHLACIVSLMVSALLILASCGQPANGTAGATATTSPQSPAVANVSPTSTPKSAPHQDITRIQMIDAHSGWAETLQKTILHTVDGAATWTDVTPKYPKQSLFQFSTEFLDATHAWSAIPVGGNQTQLQVFRTTDAGQTWQNTTVDFSNQYGVTGSQITFLDAQHGWIMVGMGVAAGSMAVAILGTSDGGATWSLLSAARPTGPSSANQLPFGGLKSGVGFTDTSTGYISGTTYANNRAWFYVTHDGGRTWHPQSLSLPRHVGDGQLSLSVPQFFNASDGVLTVIGFTPFSGAHDGFAVYVTHDGGATWNVGTPLTPVPQAVTFVDNHHGWTSNYEGKSIQITSDGGQHWLKITPTSTTSFQDFLSFSFISPAAGWAIGTTDPMHPDNPGTNVLLKTNDGGQSWTKVAYRLSAG